MPCIVGPHQIFGFNIMAMNAVWNRSFISVGPQIIKKRHINPSPAPQLKSITWLFHIKVRGGNVNSFRFYVIERVTKPQ